MSRAWLLGNVHMALGFANLDGAAAQSGDIASDGRNFAARSRAADDLRDDLSLQREFTQRMGTLADGARCYRAWRLLAVAKLRDTFSAGKRLGSDDVPQAERGPLAPP